MMARIRIVNYVENPSIVNYGDCQESALYCVPEKLTGFESPLKGVIIAIVIIGSLIISWLPCCT